MKNLKFFVLFFLFFVGIGVNASTKTYERLDSNNYGVNKHWNIGSHNLGNVKNTPLVDASEKVYDFADILTDSEEKQVYKYIDEFIKKTNIDMVFVSVDMAYSSDSKNEVFASDFYDYNDFGIDFDKYSGVLLLRNDYDNDRYYNIYTFGNAQLYFDYDRLEYILDDIYSSFVNKDYVSGIRTFVSECSSYYDRGVASKYKYSYVDDNGYIKKYYHVPFVVCFAASTLITFFIMLALVKKNRMIKKATRAKEYLDKNSVSYSEKSDTFINSHTSSYTVSSSSGGGGGSHSGSSGGGHSSGGGRHG